MHLVGLAASVLTVAAFVPQAYRAVVTRRTRDLALSTYVILISTGTLWTIYGIERHDAAIYITNSLVGLLALTICVVKIRDRD